LPKRNIRIYILLNIPVTRTYGNEERPENLAAYPYHMRKERNNGCKASSETIKKTATFEELFLRHLDGAYNLARWIVERDPDAQAIVQEAYIQASSAFVEFREADARAWLLAIVRNVAYTWIQKRGSNSSMIPFEEAIHVAPSEKRQPVLYHEKRERQLHEALSRLPVEFREVLVLREIEGWSYKQLASALNVSSGTVMSRLSQARRRLRQEGDLLQIGASTSFAYT
jgi:RNA polymerase sigma-70 factor (ECF subfamily)